MAKIRKLLTRLAIFLAVIVLLLGSFLTVFLSDPELPVEVRVMKTLLVLGCLKPGREEYAYVTYASLPRGQWAWWVLNNTLHVLVSDLPATATPHEFAAWLVERAGFYWWPYGPASKIILWRFAPLPPQVRRLALPPPRKDEPTPKPTQPLQVAPRPEKVEALDWRPVVVLILAIFIASLFALLRQRRRAYGN